MTPSTTCRSWIPKASQVRTTAFTFCGSQNASITTVSVRVRPATTSSMRAFRSLLVAPAPTAAAPRGRLLEHRPPGRVHQRVDALAGHGRDEVDRDRLLAAAELLLELL